MNRFPIFLLLLLFCYPSAGQDTTESEADTLMGTARARDVEFDQFQGSRGTDSLEVDTTAAVVRTWVLREDFTLQQDVILDTFKTGFQVYNPVYKHGISNTYLGNTGLAAKSNLLYWKQQDVPHLFLQPYAPYLYTHDNTVYYNVRKPYSLLGYTTAITSRLKREESFSAIHTQNINPFFNFGAQVKLGASEGQYLHQKAGTSHFRAWTSYNRGDYSMHGSYNRNTFRIHHSGGLKDDSLFRVTAGDERTFPVKLSDAQAELRNNDVQLTQRYRFGKESAMPDSSALAGVQWLRERTRKTGSISHTFRYDRNWRLYRDNLGTSSLDYYSNYYYDTLQSHDSTFFRSITNTVQLMLDENPNRKNDFGARAFAVHELERYAFSRPYTETTPGGNDTLTDGVSGRYYNNIAVGASLVHTVGGGWNWVMKGKTFLSGYKAGDLLLSGEITRFIHGKEAPSRIRLGGRFSLSETDYFYQHFASNHFRWENEFRKTKELLATLDYSNPNLGLDARAFYSVLTGHVYVDTDTMPAQFNKGILLLGGVAGEHLVFGPFHSIHTLAYQFSSNRFVVRIPDIAYHTSSFIDFTVVRNVLTFQIGFDFYYNTLFSGYAYVPATGFFYHQNERKLGNYPYFDAFVTARLKTVRAFFKLEHPHAQKITKDYFQVLDYPMPGMSIKFGLAWSFYD